MVLPIAKKVEKVRPWPKSSGTSLLPSSGLESPNRQYCRNRCTAFFEAIKNKPCADKGMGQRDVRCYNFVREPDVNEEIAICQNSPRLFEDGWIVGYIGMDHACNRTGEMGSLIRSSSSDRSPRDSFSYSQRSHHMQRAYLPQHS